MPVATRIFEIDAAHRVTNHESKCRSLHGHRYKFEATVESNELQTSGSSEGMVMDFGVIKKAMSIVIDHHLDHGMIMWINDPLVATLYPSVDIATARKVIDTVGHAFCKQDEINTTGKLLLVNFVPTAENMVRFFFDWLNNVIKGSTDTKVWMKKLRLWETPNCYSDYEG